MRARLLTDLRAAEGSVSDELAAAEVLGRFRTDTDLGSVRFSKATVHGCPMSAESLSDEFGGGVAVLPSSMPGRAGSVDVEVSIAGVDKASGARIVVEALGLRREDVVAVGDGRNDLELIEYAGVGVAVEDGDPLLVAAADRVVPGPRSAGLVDLFTDLGLVAAGVASD